MRKTDEQRFYERPNISDVNKAHVKAFIKSYTAEQTTKNKMFSFLPYVLSMTPDIKATMLNNGELVDIFDKLHDKLSPSTYKVVSDSTKSLCKWLNNGEQPESCKNIKGLTKKEKARLSRANRSDYKTLSWEDGLKMIDLTNSMQIKALVMTELDAGFRPHELEMLNYGDVRKDGKFIVCSVQETKTAKPRDVLIYKAAPFLSRWLDMHPTKKKNDPLWLCENPGFNFEKGRTVYTDKRYTYDGVRQLLRRLSIRAGFAPISLYMMRHSAVALTKQERMNTDLAAEKFGHDIVYYVNVYGRLTAEQKVNRFKAHYGEKNKEDEDKPVSQVCPICNEINEPERTHCVKCNSPLTLTVALKEEHAKDSKIEKLQRQVDEMANRQKEDMIELIDEYMRRLKK